MTLIVALLSGCVTANYYDVARPVRPSVEDQMSEGTKRKILVENEKIAKLCGVKP